MKTIACSTRTNMTVILLTIGVDDQVQSRSAIPVRGSNSKLELTEPKGKGFRPE
jgi:hypothetical protein